MLLMGCAAPIVAPSATPVPTATAAPPTQTPLPPSATPVPPSPTLVPTATNVPPTATALPKPTQTVAPTATAGKVSADKFEPCKLFKTTDLEGVFGKLEAEPETKPNEQFGGIECTLVAEHGLVNIIQLTGSKAKMAEMINTIKKQDAPLKPVSGFGDEAYMAVMKAAPNAPGVLGAFIMVKGNTVFAMSVITDIGIREEENKITHAEVLEAAANAEPKLTYLFKELIAQL